MPTNLQDPLGIEYADELPEIEYADAPPMPRTEGFMETMLSPKRWFETQKDVASATGKGVVGLVEGAVGIANLVPTFKNPLNPLEGVEFGAVGRTLENLTGYDPKLAKETIGKIESPLLKKGRSEVDKAEGIGGTVMAILRNPQTITAGVAESLPSMLGSAGIGKVAMKAAPALSGLAASALGEGVITSGQQLEQTRQESPSKTLTPKQALINLASGAATGFISVFGGKLASKIGVEDINVMLTKHVPTDKKLNVALRIIGGVINEGLIEELPQSLQEAIASNLAAGKAWDEGVVKQGIQGAIQGGFVGGGVNIFGGPHNAPEGRGTSPVQPNVGTRPVGEQTAPETPVSTEGISLPLIEYADEPVAKSSDAEAVAEFERKELERTGNTLEEDVTRYNELVASVKGKSLDEAQPIAAEIEALKNKYGGFPPKLPSPVETKPLSVRQKAAQFKDLVLKHSIYRLWGDEGTIEKALNGDPESPSERKRSAQLGPAAKTAKKDYGTAVKSIMDEAARELGLDHDRLSSDLTYRAENIEKILELDRKSDAFQKATESEGDSSGKIEVPIEDLNVGDVLIVDGKPVKVERTQKATRGYPAFAILDGGETFGKQTVPSGHELFVEGYEPVKVEAPVQKSPITAAKNSAIYIPTAKEHQNMRAKRLARFEETRGKLFARKYFQAVDRMFSPADVLEYRVAGPVILKDGKAMLQLLSGTDMKQERWAVANEFDVSDQFQTKPSVNDAPAGNTPKLGSMEKGTGDLLKGQTEDFALVGEKGTDIERVEAAKSKAQADAAEAKRIQDEQQQMLPIESEKPAVSVEKSVTPEKVRVGNNPTVHTVIRELERTPVEVENDEHPVEVRNDKTGKTEIVDRSDLTTITEKSADEKAARKKPTKQELNDALKKAGLDPSVFPDAKSKKNALERAIAKIEEAQKKLRGSRKTLNMGVPKAMLDLALETARLSLKAGNGIVQAIDAAVAAVRAKFGNDAFSEDDLRSSLTSELTRKPSKGKFLRGSYQTDTAKGMAERADAFMEGKTDEQIIEELTSYAGGNNAIAIDDSAFPSVVAKLIGKLAERLKPVASTPAESLERSRILGLLERLRGLGQQKGSASGQNLVAQKAYNKIDWAMPILAWMGIAQARWKKVMGLGTTGDVDKTIKDWLRGAGEDAKRVVADIISGNSGVLDALFAMFPQSGRYKVEKQAAPDISERIMSQFPLMKMREQLEIKGGKQLEQNWWQILAGVRAPEGHVWTAAKALQGQLSGIFREALAKAGIEPAKIATLTDAEKLAMTLGKGELRRGVIQRADKAVQDEIERRREEAIEQAGEDADKADAANEKFDQLLDLWNQATSAMQTEPGSKGLFRRMVHQKLKGLGVVFGKDDEGAKHGVISGIIKDIQGAATNNLDLREVQARLEFEFDQVAGMARNRREMDAIYKAAKQSFAETASPEKAADSILSRYAKEQSYTLSFTPKIYNQVKEAFAGLLRGDFTEAEFVASLETVGVGQGQRDALLNVARRELKSREFHKMLKDQDAIEKLLASGLDSILRKVGKDSGINWSEMFLDNDRATQAERRKYLFDQIRKHPQLKNLTKEQAAKLEQALSSAWEKARMDVFRREFDKLVKLPKVELEKVVKELQPELIRQANLGTLDDAAFRNALAKKLGLPSLDGETAAKITVLAQKAQKLPEGVLRNKSVKEMADIIMEAAPAHPFDILRDYWYANTLSGTRTMANILAGSWINGALMAGQEAFDLAVAKKDPKTAARLFQAFLLDTVEGLANAVDVIRTGDYTRRAEFAENMGAAMSGKGRWDTLEAMRKSDKWWKKIIGQSAYFRRIVVGLDYVGAIASRGSGLIYNAALSNDPKELESALNRFNKESAKQAKTQAQAELGSDAKWVDLRARQLEIMESEISDESKQAAKILGEVAALNSNPIGFFGILYSGLKSLPGIAEKRGMSRKGAEAVSFATEVALGMPFVRASINMMQNGSNWMPIVGGVNYLRTLLGKKLPPGNWARVFAVLDEHGQPITEDRRRLILASQAMGLTATIALYALAKSGGGDDDDEGFEVSGTWRNFTPQQKKDLMAKGERPLSMRIGGRWVPYANYPFAGALAVVGAARDHEKKSGENITNEGFGERALNAMLGGGMYFKDMSMMSGLTQILGAGAASTDEADAANRFLAQQARSATGLIPGSSLLREVDTWFDPSLYRPTANIDYWTRSIPFVRRTVGEGPEYNMAGLPVENSLTPQARLVAPKPPDDAVVDALSRLIAKGKFPHHPGSPTWIVNGEKLSATKRPQETYQYQVESLKAWRKQMLSDIKALKKMTPEEYDDYYESSLAPLSKDVKQQIQARMK